MSAWISNGDEPVLVKATVTGRPGFMVLPAGEDADEIVFTSEKALISWLGVLNAQMEEIEDAPTYEEWLEENE